MSEKNTSSEHDTLLKLEVLAKEKEDVRLKLVTTAEELRLKAKQLATVAEEKETVRRNLAVTAKQLATIAKENERIKGELEITAKQLATVAEEKEDVRLKLVTTAEELAEAHASLEQKVRVRTQDLENANIAVRNILEDLNIEKSKVEEAKAKDEAMLASIGDGVIIVDPAGKIISMNKSAQNLLGWKETEVVGKLLFDVVLIEDKKGVKVSTNARPMAIALASGTTTQGIYYHIRKDKTKFPAAVMVAPVILDNKIIGAIEVFRDISKEKEIDKRKSEFVSLASHQLRTPLGIIKWYLEAMENDEYFKKSPPSIRGYYDEIYKSNERVLNLVRDLLSISRIEQGKIKNAPASVNIIQIVTEIVGQMKIMAHKRDIALSLTIQDKNIPFITIDTLRLHEVIENLIVNAIEYTMAGGLVDITVTLENDTLSITIKDTGIGISEANQEKIFTKFFRAEEAISYNPEGSGLGLYVVKSYVEGWGGRITVTSTEKKGSTFTISLPLLKLMHEGGDLK